MAEFYVICDYKQPGARYIRARMGRPAYQLVTRGTLGWRHAQDEEYLMEPVDIVYRTDSAGVWPLADALAPCTLARIRAEKGDKGFALEAVLAHHIDTDERANAIIAELTRPVVIDDELLGELRLNRAKGVFEGMMPEQYIFLTVTGAEDMPTLRALTQQLENLADQAERFARRTVKGKFKKANNMYLRRVDARPAGHYSVTLTYDDPVWAHSDLYDEDREVVVHGSLETGLLDAKPNF